ncbi:glycosyltransferase family 2 protein [Motilimonas sp. E26]|uniref:glycosyltransferase family 2 protein n=1 Tax=Motilimonas sp. E26 TaxID=2865674 RepID=UPI001E4641D3|nr:glycosyltransferase family 2 protein [Motilimonas sp. E26]MCE0558578.1 glycosyltransferase family 2 protein [Motilimonas sp. E26]
MNESSPLVSIVIPLYNAENYIEETLQSVLNQTYNNYEVIVVDNASTDSSMVIVNRFAFEFKNLKVFCCEVNSGGPAKPRNIGIENAQGEYIAFLDSDDIWHPDKLEKQLCLLKGGGWDFVSSSIHRIDEHGNTLIKGKGVFGGLSFRRTAECDLKGLMYRNNVITSSVILKKTNIKGVRFNENDFFKCVEDYLFWLEVLSNNSGFYLVCSDEFVSYRVIESSLSSKDGKYLMLVKSVLVNCYSHVKFKAPYNFLGATIFNFFRAFRLMLLK